jgi:GNAT superfamily N-acetyltransferase
MGAERPEIVPLRAVPTKDVLALLETCLGPGAVGRSEAFWRWKHEESPFGPSPGLVALAGGEPVAVRVFLRWRWRSGSQELPAVRAVDTATHPAWRRQGLFRRLSLELVERSRREGAAFVFNTPNPKSRAGYLSMGWSDAGRVPLLARVLRPGRLAAALFSRPPGREREAQPPPLSPGGLEELLADPALEPFLAAWATGEPRLHTPRTPAYLRWRYARAPGLRYGALWRLEGTSGAVIIARGRRRRGLAEVTLSEMLVSRDPAGLGAAEGLLARFAAAGEADYLAAVAAAGSPERAALVGAGFRALPWGPRLTVRPLDKGSADDGPDPRSIASWRPAIGDLEVF